MTSSPAASTNGDPLRSMSKKEVARKDAAKLLFERLFPDVRMAINNAIGSIGDLEAEIGQAKEAFN